MQRKWFSVLGLCVVAALLLAQPDCARNSHLTSITVQPSGATFQGVGASIQFRAIGAYTHPPRNVDISDQVQWSIDSQNLATVTSTGLVTATSICGSGNLSASLEDGNNLVTGSAFLTGSGIGSSTCSQASLTVSIGSGSGSVTSSPPGIACPGTCSAVFALDTPVVLSATPAGGATSTTWGGCAPSGNSCSVTMLANETVTVTFQ